MQLEQNLFSIYRLILKLPRYLFIGCLLLLVFIAATQFINIFNNKEIDLSRCMLDYVISKHSLLQNSSTNTNNTHQNNQTATDQYLFLDYKTLINVELGSSSQKCQFTIDYPYKFDLKNTPLMVIAQNQQLSYLREKPESYIKDHNITFDKLVIPDLQIQQPMFSYFYSKQMQQNELIIESIRSSILKLKQSEFTTYALENNFSNVKLTFTELYLTFYITDKQTKYSRTINLYQIINIKQFPMFIFKILFMITILMFLYLLSIFIGLFIRFTMIFIYTAFLIVYDRYMNESWGWVHQYLVILQNRFRQNTVTTLKFLFFYVVSNLGMYGLLAFGSYCIVKKLIYPMITLPIQAYTDFFFKIIFFIELYLYVFCRSRTSITFFPQLSFTICYGLMIIASLKTFGNVIILLNLNFTLQLLLFTVFILIEQSIQNESQKGLIGEYCPSMSKPRMLFYAGYDISWEKTLPPIWTYFTRWFDYSYFSESQKCLIEKDYQLLYGRMLGLNERQQIPEFQDQQQERQQLNDQPSNEMNLIQNDV